MKRVTSVIAAVMMVALVVQVSSAGSDGKNILEFDTMFGVDGPFVGTMNPVREVPGGGLPWQIERGRGELSANGEVRVRVEGPCCSTGRPCRRIFRGRTRSRRSERSSAASRSSTERSRPATSDELEELLTDGWRRQAPRAIVKEFDQLNGAP
jgi:hypothetical protein